MKAINKLSQSKDNGVASILVTVILVALLSLVVVSYALVARRENVKSVQNQTGQAAYYAAESGISDAMSYAENWIAGHPNSSLNITNCTQLIRGSSPAINPKISGDGATKYTCVLVSTAVPSLQFSSIALYKSQVIKVTPSTQMTKILLSWQTTDSNNNGVPSGAGTPLFDETTWGRRGYEPMVRVSFYPVPASNNLNMANTNSRTFFLYPTSANVANAAVPTLNYRSAGNSIRPASCYHGNQADGGSFGTINDYDCNLILNNLPNVGSKGSFYMQITPIYDSASFQIRGQAGSRDVSFINSQAEVDVTAQSASASKRLHARINISAQNIASNVDGLPVDALQSAFAICKRVQVPTSGSPSIDSSSTTDCQTHSL